MPRTPEQQMDDYRTFRGKCKEYCEEAVKADPSLSMVRGYYTCAVHNYEPHWWTVRQDGTIYDPTKGQFVSNGNGVYTPFNGYVDCAECGKEIAEEDARLESNYAFCSTRCNMRFVGL